MGVTSMGHFVAHFTEILIASLTISHLRKIVFNRHVFFTFKILNYRIQWFKYSLQLSLWLYIYLMLNQAIKFNLEHLSESISIYPLTKQVQWIFFNGFVLFVFWVVILFLGKKKKIKT